MQSPADYTTTNQLRSAVFSVLLLCASPALSATFLVVNTDDAGAGSLREAILSANALAGEDRIEFAVPGPGPHIIAPLTALPFVSDSAVIDGYSQPGAEPATATEPATLQIVISGENTTDSTGIEFSDFASVEPPPSLTVSGLVLHSWGLACISVRYIVSVVGNYIGTDYTGASPRPCRFGILIGGSGPSGAKVIGGSDPASRNLVVADETGIAGGGDTVGIAIIGNYVGTDVTGTIALHRGTHGVSTRNSTIGGAAPGDGNLISGWDVGINSIGSGGFSVPSSGNLILGNRIGTDVSGTVALSNAIGIVASMDDMIGGATTGSGNLISGNELHGVSQRVSAGEQGVTIQGNLIGTDAGGTLPLGNAGNGVFLPNNLELIGGNLVGGTAPGEGNIIAFNGRSGVLISGNRRGTESLRENRILGNAIYANQGLGIDLLLLDEGSFPDGDGVTENDPGDADINGPNRLQNYPVLSAAATSGAGSMTIAGVLNSTPDTTGFRVEFFSSAVCNALRDGSPDPDLGDDFGEGEIFLGHAAVDTDSSGDAPFLVSIATTVAVGSYITATATSVDGTSEFSKCVVAQIDSDSDGIADADDNCQHVANPDQCNTNAGEGAGQDSFGNACDADFDNNGVVNTFDLTIMRNNYGAVGVNDADIDCNGIVNSFDLGEMRAMFGTAPGP